MRSLLELVVLATAVAGLLYFGYFLLAPWIWNQNVQLRPGEVMPWLNQYIYERDGIELYALYVLMLLNLPFVYSLSYEWNRFTRGPANYLLALALVVACVFIGFIGFHPPMSNIADHAIPDILAHSFTVMAVILPIVLLLYRIQQYSFKWTLAASLILLIPICFISTEPLSWLDYGYILAPALRLFHGVNVSEIYFQYDLMLSLIGLAWMKLGLDLNSFQIVGQCAYYLFLLSVFTFSRRWFLDKRLSVFLLVALVLVRIYAGPNDVIKHFQVTPLRLDLWLILLVLVYFKGAHHWSAGLFCGLMLIFHNDFGIIYSAAYIQLLLTLCLIDTGMIPDKVIKTVSTALATFLKRNYRNLALIVVGTLMHYLLFRNPSIRGDFDYVHLGIGFIKITTDSFYWYVVAISGLAFVLLLRLRAVVPGNYLAAGFCLLYLVIGNSLYFFGRSHENNIINISAILLLLFFLLLDIAVRYIGNAPGKTGKPFLHRNLSIIISLAFITSITIWYGDSIIDKASTQARNAGKRQFIYPSMVSEQDVLNTLDEVKSVTGDDPKVYFINTKIDFLYYYYGGYVPVGYYSPLNSWVSRREFNKFLQGLLDQGYYLVVDYANMNYVLSPLRYSNSRIVAVTWAKSQ
jgi:hypothetical protein